MKKRLVTLVLTASVLANILTGCGLVKSNNEETAPAFEEELFTEEVSEACEEEPAEFGTSEAVMASDMYEDSTAVNASNEDMAFSIAENNYATKEFVEEDIEWFDEEIEKSVEENETTDAAEKPLSTFAADVDTASYSNVRRMINDGYSLYSIPADEVRTEEIVNFFKYNYEEPKNGDVFNVNAQVSTCPWNKENKLMTLGVNTATMEKNEIPDCNIVFLVDVSGSMSGENKLPLIQKAMAMLVDKFDSKDRISIVTYASGVTPLLDGCPGNRSKVIIKTFENLSASGSTNGGDGIIEAYRIAQRNYIEGGVNRVIICSDGDFNVGLTSQRELENLISEKKDTGIFLSTLGFGMGNYKDTTMETLADKGNGNYAYIDDLTEAKRVLVDEMSSTFMTVAKDVKLQVEFNPAVVKEYRLVGYENRKMSSKDFKDDTKDGGEIGAGHQVTALYEITLADDSDEEELKYQENKLSKKGALSDEYCTLSIAYKEPEENESSYLEYPIGVECYSSNPTDDFKLAAAAAQASLALKNSSYLVDLSQEEAIKSSIKIVRNIENKYDDEYVAEFGDLMEKVIEEEERFNWFE